MTPQESNSNDALGSGPGFPIRLDGLGGVETVRGEDRIRQSIMLILSTAKGERVMRPDFGCDIHRFAFTTLDSTSFTLIKSAVREALVLWEPRIAINDLTVNADPDHGRLFISIEYTIRITNTRANLVYPFYLEIDA